MSYNQRVRDIDEMLAGMYEALGSREPNAAVAAKIRQLEAEREDAKNSDWHGWECYCRSCCE